MEKKISVSLISMVVLLAISIILSGCGGNKATAAPKSPKELVIGKWTSGRCSMEFTQKGEITEIEDGEQKQYNYKLAAIDGSKDYF